jgi:hypothetical protein
VDKTTAWSKRMTAGLAASRTVPAEQTSAAPLAGADASVPPHGSISADLGEADVHIPPREAALGLATNGEGEMSEDIPVERRRSERSNASSTASHARISLGRSPVRKSAKVRQARRAAAAQSRGTARLVEAQTEMHRVMARLQQEYVKLASGVNCIQNAIGLSDARYAAVPTPKDGAAASGSSEEDSTTLGGR